MYRVGIELNAAPAEYARKMAGCEIHEVPFEEFRSDNKFDVITMINVLSHIPPDGLFSSVRSLLESHGKLILRTSEMSKDASRRSQFDWGIPDDLHFLGLTTLDFICQKYGFKIAKRIRTAYSDEVFLPARWKSPGRSHWKKPDQVCCCRHSSRFASAKGSL
jgi:hypothetical protein